jgi:hypothetical protein
MDKRVYAFSVWFEGQSRSCEGKITWGTIDLVLVIRETMEMKFSSF